MLRTPTASASFAARRPWLGSARVVGQHERGVLRAVARCVQRADPQRAERQLPTVIEWLVLVGRLSGAVDVDTRSRRRHQASVSRDVVGVVVRLEHVRDVDGSIARQLQVRVALKARVYDRRHTRLLVSDQVGGAAEIVMGDLLEKHQPRDSRELSTENIDNMKISVGKGRASQPRLETLAAFSRESPS
jgi:hypothetical protein